MAYIFELWVECADPDATHQMQQYLDNQHYHLLTGRTIHWTATIATADDPTNCTVSGSSLDLPDRSYAYVPTLQQTLELTEVGLRLYHHLHHAPPFRYARLDWEAGTIPACDLPTWCTTSEGRPALDLHCVLDDALFTSLGRPHGFKIFRPGYWWQPYEGERYRPLESNDQPPLVTLAHTLFPSDYYPLR